jgi:prevent-host-death family protein
MKVSICDAKNKLSELVRRAEQGEEVILSRHGRAVVKLTASPSHETGTWFSTWVDPGN